MKLERDTLTAMEAFVESVKAGSFSAAALRLGLTPSGVSKLVARLEDRLRAKLLQRTTRRMQLTQVGALYFERARRMLDELNALEREVEARDHTPRGTLRVSAPTVLGHVRVVPLVIEFQAKFSEVRVELDLTDRRADLVVEQIDVALRITAAPPPSLIARRLDDDTRVLCASPAYLKRRGRPEEPTELTSHDCLVFVTDMPLASWRLRVAPGDPRVEAVGITGRLYVNNTLSLWQAALAGLGIADLPRYLVEDDLRAGRLLSLLEEHVPVERSVFAIYAPSPFVPVRVREFVRLLERRFRGSAPRGS